MGVMSWEVDLDKALGAAVEAAGLGREVLLRYFGDLSNIAEKDQAGLVTEADLESERVICDCLRHHFPDIDILGEESSFGATSPKELDSQTRWVVDPLDGTTNYVHHLPIFCISIGLEVEGELAVGVIDVPRLDLIYTAVSGRGAHRNGQPIAVSGRSEMREALVSTGFMPHLQDSLQQKMELVANIIGRSRGVRRMGAAAYDLCLVAEGAYDFYFEADLNPWDTAAGTLLVREAGGKVTDYQNTHYHPQMNTILASNKTLHNQAISILTPKK